MLQNQSLQNESFNGTIRNSYSNLHILHKQTNALKKNISGFLNLINDIPFLPSEIISFQTSSDPTTSNILKLTEILRQNKVTPFFPYQNYKIQKFCEVKNENVFLEAPKPRFEAKTLETNTDFRLEFGKNEEILRRLEAEKREKLEEIEGKLKEMNREIVRLEGEEGDFNEKLRVLEETNIEADEKISGGEWVIEHLGKRIESMKKKKMKNIARNNGNNNNNNKKVESFK